MELKQPFSVGVLSDGRIIVNDVGNKHLLKIALIIDQVLTKCGIFTHDVCLVFQFWKFFNFLSGLVHSILFFDLQSNKNWA